MELFCSVVEEVEELSGEGGKVVETEESVDGEGAEEEREEIEGVEEEEEAEVEESGEEEEEGGAGWSWGVGMVVEDDLRDLRIFSYPSTALFMA